MAFRDNRWRHIPPRLPFWYRRHLESVIQDAKAKREANHFVADRQENVDQPERDDKPRRPYRRRHFPQQPRGAYLQILNELIEPSRTEREQHAP
jgi:hypothetical protein